MNLEQYREENELLWTEILDNSEWFVSPRGDSYSRDEELGQRGITSLVFQIDRAFPREHRVVMNLQEIEEPFVFWLSNRRQLLDAERGPLVANIGLREVFLNSVLRRLFSITAKLYGTYGGHQRGEEGGVWGYMYRRAHYTVLTSDPPRRVYTMQSIQARTHAAEILEDYGINIYGEMARRRTIHRLGENQFLTFHRESNPDIPGWIPEPNELVYNPARVQEAIQNIRAGRHPHQA